MLGGHGRRAGMSDTRQGKARGETYLNQAGAGIKGLSMIAVFVVALVAGVVFVADPDLRPWGFGVLALGVVSALSWMWWRRSRRPHIDERLSDLSQR